MNKTYREFILSVNEHTRPLMEACSWIGDLKDDISAEELKQIIIDKRPKNKRDITVMLTTIARYARYCNNDYLLNVVEQVRAINRSVIWQEAKPNAEQTFFTRKEFNKVMKGLNPNDPDEGFEENTLYYRTLFWAVYEGVYSKDMSIIENVRASDIDLENKQITLKDDKGNAYTMNDMPEQLLNDLIMCSKLQYWEQKKRGNGIARYDMVGKYPDACFKALSSKARQNLKAGYQAKLKKITTTYFIGKITPIHIYYSGIAHRIADRLKANDISVDEAFRERNNAFLPVSIIRQELQRSHYNNPVHKFKEIIDSHLEIMKEE